MAKKRRIRALISKFSNKFKNFKSFISFIRSTLNDLTLKFYSFMLLVFKDLLSYYQNKSSVLMVFLSPLVIMIIVGAIFGSNSTLERDSTISGIHLGVCDYDQDIISQGILTNMRKSWVFDIDYFDITFFPEEECIETVRKGVLSGRYGVALIFPTDLTNRVKANEQVELLSFIDNSRTEIAGTVRLFLIAYTSQLNKEISSNVVSSFKDFGAASEDIEDIEFIVKDASSSVDLLYANVGVLRSAASSTGADVSELNELEDNLGTIKARLNSFKSQLSVLKSRFNEINALNPYFLFEPIKLEMSHVYDSNRKLDFLFPGIVGLVLMFSCLLLSSTTLIKEKNIGVFLRSILSPINVHVFFLARIFSNLVISLIQVFILLLLANFIFKVRVLNTFNFVVTSLFISLSFITIGLLLGSFITSENTNILVIVALCMPMLFLSGIFFAIELMPFLTRSISLLMPLSYGIKSLRMVSIYDLPIIALWKELGILSLQSLVAYFITIKRIERI